ncbi:MAG: DDE-type integrase/transposase/recombinase [Planctomycetes bacterium]|nr:DDE-type integrase/transposase/recombinase [Planctomycetota bacterium]
MEGLAQAVTDGTRCEDIEEAKARKQCWQRWGEFPKQPNASVAFERFAASVLSDESLAKAVGGSFSRSTLYAWGKAYRDDGIVALIPQYTKRGRGQSVHVGAEALNAIKNLILARDLSTKAAMEIVKGEAAREHRGDPAWAVPSYSIVRCELRPLLPAITRRLANSGPRSAKAECIPKMQRDFESIAAGDEYVGDERTLDIWCRILTARGWRAVRLKWTVWMDMRSRVIVGWVLAAHANSQTILGALKRAFGTYGKPRILRTDWGEDYRKAARHGEYRDFDGARIGGILDDLGIEVRRVAPYTPYAKPIESFFGGFKDSFDKLFDTFWGGCPSERHEDRARYIKANLEKLPTLDSVESALAKWIDVYHETPHSAVDLFGKTPLEAMDAFRAEPIRLESETVLEHLFCEFIGPRLVRRDGVRLDGRWYGNGDARLVAMQGQSVLLAIQPDDASRAMVCGLDREPLFKIECLSIRGLTLQQVKEQHRERRKLLTPYREDVRKAKAALATTTPEQLLTLRLAGIRASRGEAPEPVIPPSQLRVRPAMEDAIATAGKAPSDVVSKAHRTGTDDEPLSVLDVLDDERLRDDAPMYSGMSVEDFI